MSLPTRADSANRSDAILWHLRHRIDSKCWISSKQWPRYWHRFDAGDRGHRFHPSYWRKTEARVDVANIQVGWGRLIPFRNGACDLNNSTRLFDVSLSSVAHQRDPTAGNQIARTAASHGGRAIDSTRPIGNSKELMRSKFSVAVENDGCSFRCKAVLKRCRAEGYLLWSILHATLCVSQLILITPGRRKSNGFIGNPASSMKAIRKPPRHASTCNGIPCWTAILKQSGWRKRSSAMSTWEISSIGSIEPCGKLGADATSFKRIRRRFSSEQQDLTMHVFLVIARRIFFRSTMHVWGSSGIRFKMILKYEQA